LNSLTLQIKIGSFEVAHWIELVKLQNLFMMNLRSGRLIFFVIWWNFENWCVSSYINWLFHLILSIALLFELLMYWWRNQLVELDWYKIFLCGFEVFECFEELSFWKFVNLLMFSDVRCFIDFGKLMFDVSSYNKWLTNLLNSSELVDIVLC
jgi:hypothetical protein